TGAEGAATTGAGDGADAGAASRPAMSARMMRPPGPLPVTCDRSRWLSLTSFRTRGDAIWRLLPLALPFAFALAAAATEPGDAGAEVTESLSGARVAGARS